ncbi:tetraspanin family protein [Mycoplasma todarodis]|uniref:SHOCT domain-containing protein n=1 Tax=Mycoplasma todarodis TaxID=1937191 RepID=A0A4R0XPS6_9MOLU|nr:tetraspanin family protein [Mycoplasma todarodis]TCG11552.1 hypothetical protein C4B25_01060 [Mycoplasma todarodis]
MNKKTKLLIITNFILWILAMILILFGAVFVFIAGKGYGTKGNVDEANQLIHVGEQGSTAVGGILIAISVFILALSITFFALKLNKKAKRIVVISFISTLIVSVIMVVMSILDIAHVWSIWPWLINFGCLTNFVLVLLAFKTITITRISKSESILQIDALNENGFLTKDEYKTIKERAKRILKTESRPTGVIEKKEEVNTKPETQKPAETKVPEEKVEKQDTTETNTPKEPTSKEQIKTAKVEIKEAKKQYKASKKR